MIALIIIFSVILNTFLNNILVVNSDGMLNSYIFLYLLAIIYPFFKKDKYYLIIASVLGLISSHFISSIIFNISIYFLIALLITIVFKKIKYNLLNVLIVSNVVYLVYSLALGMLLSISYFNFDIFNIFREFYTSVIINNVYIILMYLIIKFTYNESSKKLKVS